MDNFWDFAGTALGAIATIAVGILALAPSIGQRRSIQSDLEIVALLPDGDTKTALLAHVNDRIAKLLPSSGSKRHAPGILLGILLLLAAIALAVPMFAAGSWWLLLLAVPAFMAILALMAFGMYSAKIPRDDRGVPVNNKFPWRG